VNPGGLPARKLKQTDTRMSSHHSTRNNIAYFKDMHTKSINSSTANPDVFQPPSIRQCYIQTVLLLWGDNWLIS